MKKVFLIICDIFMEAFLTFVVINAFEGFISNPNLITFAAVVFFIFMMFVSPFILWAKMNDASDPDYSISEDGLYFTSAVAASVIPFGITGNLMSLIFIPIPVLVWRISLGLLLLTDGMS